MDDDTAHVGRWRERGRGRDGEGVGEGGWGWGGEKGRERERVLVPLTNDVVPGLDQHAHHEHPPAPCQVPRQTR